MNRLIQKFCLTERPEVSLPPWSRFAGVLFIVTYGMVLACLLGYQSLWVDEIMQLIGTRSGTLEHIEPLTRTGVGSVPMGWLPQLLAIRIFGYSAAISRIPSAVSSIVCCWIVFLTAKEIGMRHPLLPAFLLSLMPLHFRYALEGRPYSQGVLFSTMATLLLVKLSKRFSVPLFSAYTLALVCGIYSQPFACFTSCSHFVWAVTSGFRQKRLIFYTAAAFSCMILAFIPWYIYGSPLWRQTIQEGSIHFHISWKTPLMLIREISGAGYIGGCSLLALAVLGFQKGKVDVGTKRLLASCSIVPIICVVAVDSYFDYFLAIRQMIFILPPLAILACLGILVLMCLAPRLTFVATAFLIGFLVVSDFRWLNRPREDWALAAQAVHKMSLSSSACTLYSPANSLPYYTFFEPRLADRSCPPDTPSGPAVLVVSPYATDADVAKSREILRGKSLLSKDHMGMSTIEVFQ